MAHFTQSAMLKREIEAKLASRIPAALSPQPQQAPKLLASGVPEIDLLLGGGLPIGGISEFTGLGSSGRTSLALSLLAEVSGDSACAYIDVNDSIDPRSAAAAGVCLRNLLWVRLAFVPQETTTRKTLSTAPSLASSANTKMLVGQHGGGHHPRTETKGLDRALEKMLAEKAEARFEKKEGTPGYPNSKLSLATAPQEQIRYEHFNARRSDASDPIRLADQRAAMDARQRAEAPVILGSSLQRREKPWNRLENAIRATDQILQSGGFRVVVLDLASVPQEQALRIPSATWFRFRRAAQESDAIFLLLTQVACARSSALCVLDCSVGIPSSSQNVLCGLSRSVEVARQRLSSPLAKKAPGRAVTWEATPVWMRAAGR
jgi:recombination protein RecA